MVAPTVQQQLSALLGTDVTRLRKTDETPARISVIDVAIAISGYDANYACEAVRRFREHDEEVDAKSVHLKFPGRGQFRINFRAISDQFWTNF